MGDSLHVPFAKDPAGLGWWGYLLLPDSLHPRSDVKLRTPRGANRSGGDGHVIPSEYSIPVHLTAA